MPDRVDCRIESAPEGAVRVAFLHPFVQPAWDLLSAEPSLARLPAAARQRLADRVEILLGGHPIIDQAHPLLGGRVWMVHLLVPLGPTTFEDARRSDDRIPLIARIQEGVDRAAALGCSVVTLGASTSTVTQNGQSLLAPPGVRITSGNALTAALGAARLREAAAAAGVRDGWLGVLGATGNIGQALAQALLGPGGWRRAVLVGRDRGRLEAIALPPADSADVHLSTDVRDLSRCRVIVTVTATAEPLLFPEHLPSAGPVVIVDLAVPSPVSAAVWALPNVVRVPSAGWVPLPQDPDALPGAHVPRGTTFCCAAEGMLVALHPRAVSDVSLVGELTPAALVAVERLARLEGLWPAGPEPRGAP